MGEGTSKKPISFGRYVAFFGILLYFVAFSSFFTTRFVFPFTFRLLKIVLLIFIDKRWNVLAFLLCLAAFINHIFKSNKDPVTKDAELVDPPFDFELSSYPSFPSRPTSFTSPPFPLPSSPVSPSSSFTSPPSSPSSSFASPRSSSCSSPQSSSCYLSPRPSPPPPLKLRTRKFNYYVKMASNVSLSSEDSESSEDFGDMDINAKADKFIAEFRKRLYFENRKYADDEQSLSS